ncbi:unnamed protein product [Adineta ricciae]|uniref:Cilia- and flagella-associated protein 97 n=1 Tax=Adineta ricciae TaxID=249248 RepID=A0A813UXE7_ADIRI|nr:unnamed protein product [Adineta ricciae]CAF1072542.1 unnamed protein product [Adineta ricciae]
MLGNSNDTLPRMRDSFFDEDDDDDNNNNNPTPRAPPLISSIKIVTSKPPVYRRQSQSSSSPSPSSCCSDRDVTDVSSMGGDHHHHHQLPPRQQDSRQRHSDYDQHHPFHLQSMRHVLLGSSAPTSRPPSPANHQTQSNKKHVRIVTDDTDQNHHHRHQNSHHQQPYIHGHAKDYRRVRLTSSAINRQKQQQKIERENMKLLERLQQTRASRGLKREELLSHYDNQVGYVTYTIPPAPARAHLPPRPSSATMTTSTAPTSQKKSNIHSRPSSASHTINSNRVRSRPTSATSSVHGSSRSSSARRPIWNDRWQQQE